MVDNNSDKNDSTTSGIELIADVPVTLSIVLGEKRVTFAKLLALGRGEILQMDSEVGDEVAVYANDKLVAYGELISTDDGIGVKLTRII